MLPSTFGPSHVLVSSSRSYPYSCCNRQLFLKDAKLIPIDTSPTFASLCVAERCVIRHHRYIVDVATVNLSTDLPKKDSDVYFNTLIFCARCSTFCERRSTFSCFYSFQFFMLHNPVSMYMCRRRWKMYTPIPQSVQMYANQFHAFDGRTCGFITLQCETSPLIFLYSFASSVAHSSKQGQAGNPKMHIPGCPPWLKVQGSGSRFSSLRRLEAPGFRPGHSLPRSPSCTFPCTRALCPRVTLSAPSRHPPLPCSAIALPRPLTAPSRAPAHQPRAALSRSAPVPFLHLPPCTPAPSPCTVIAHLPPCTFPCTVIALYPAPTPCTVIALCPGPLPAPSRAPTGFLFVCAWLPFRSSFISSPVGTAIPPYTASELFVSSSRTRRLRHRALAAYRLRAPLFALCPGPLPALPVPVHRYRSLPRSPPCPFPTPVHRPRAPFGSFHSRRLRDPSVHGFLFVCSSRTRRLRYRALAALPF